MTILVIWDANFIRGKNLFDKVIRIDMTKLEITEERLAEPYKQLSGHSLSSRLVSDEISPFADPLGSHNKLAACRQALQNSTMFIPNLFF